MNKRIKKKHYKQLSILIDNGVHNREVHNKIYAIIHGRVLEKALKDPKNNKIYKRFKKIKITV